MRDDPWRGLRRKVHVLITSLHQSRKARVLTNTVLAMLRLRTTTTAASYEMPSEVALCVREVVDAAQKPQMEPQPTYEICMWANPLGSID